MKPPSDAKQYRINGNVLTFTVKKPPLIVRGLLYFTTFISFVAPLFAFLSFFSGSEKGIMSVVFMVISALIAFYLLRVTLWNIYGQETYELLPSKLKYEADFKLFKDSKREVKLDGLSFSIYQVDIKEEQKGVLIVESEGVFVRSAIKMPINQLDEVIEELLGKIKEITDAKSEKE